MFLFLVRCLIAFFFLPEGYQYERYQWDFPNGLTVPNPCDTTGIWNGVGHLGPKGSGPRNKFGQDFQNENFEGDLRQINSSQTDNKKRWTYKLCMMDSDGDGFYNGLELGDPWCMWSKLNPRTLYPALWHPGVCEPWDSPACMNRNGSVMCGGEMKCSAAYEKGIVPMTLRMPMTSVPKEDDSFTCMVFDLPSDSSYHITETKPELYNRRVLTHMVLYACDKRQVVKTPGRPFPCQLMVPPPCQTVLAVYSSESPITCFPDDVGYLIGKHHTKQLMLKVHWQNAQKLDYHDQPGMTIYISPKLRKYNIGFATLDSTVFKIPPRQDSFQVVGGCPGDCTLMRVESSVFITSAINHMHHLGRRQRVELIRNNEIIAFITADEMFDWKTPKIHKHPNPVQMYPGDSLRMICEFNSSSVNYTVTRGTSSDQEMCRTQINYYPESNWNHPICLGFKHIPLCKFEVSGYAFNCHIQSFLESLPNDPLTNAVIDQCWLLDTCSSQCLVLVAKERQHACLQGELYELWKSNLIARPDPRLQKLYKAMIPCESAYDQNAHLIPNSHSRGQIESFVILNGSGNNNRNTSARNNIG